MPAEFQRYGRKYIFVSPIINFLFLGRSIPKREHLLPVPSHANASDATSCPCLVCVDLRFYHRRQNKKPAYSRCQHLPSVGYFPRELKPEVQHRMAQAPHTCTCFGSMYLTASVPGINIKIMNWFDHMRQLRTKRRTHTSNRPRR